MILVTIFNANHPMKVHFYFESGQDDILSDTNQPKFIRNVQLGIRRSNFNLNIWLV